MYRVFYILYLWAALTACRQDSAGNQSSAEIRRQAKEAIQNAPPAASAQPQPAQQEYVDNIQMILPKGEISAGQSRCFEVQVARFKNILAMQYTLQWDKNVLVLEEVRGFKLPFMSKENFGMTFLNDGKITAVWIDNSLKGASIPDGGAVYEVCFKAIGKSGQSSEVSISGSPTAIEVVTQGDQVWGIQASKGKITIL